MWNALIYICCGSIQKMIALRQGETKEKIETLSGMVFGSEAVERIVDNLATGL